MFVIKALSLPGGGAERVLVQVSGELANRGHDVSVVSFDAEHQADFYGFQSDVQRIRLGIGRGERPSRFADTFTRMKEFRRLAGTERPDVIVGFMHSVYLPLGVALLGSGLPMVASEHVVFDHYRTRSFQLLLLRLTPLVASQVTVVSQRAKSSFPATIAQRMTVIPNPVQIPAKSAPLPTRQKLILAVGRLQREKDHRTLVAAFGLLADEFPEWRLRIVGEGELRSTLEAHVGELGLDDRVEMPGPVIATDQEYQRASIFVMPSLYESFGIATAEALAAGIPAVGFANCVGSKELIRVGVNGLLVEGPDRAAALAEGLRRLMSDDGLRERLGQAGPESVAQYSLPSVIDRWEQVLQSVVTG